MSVRGLLVRVLFPILLFPTDELPCRYTPGLALGLPPILHPIMAVLVVDHRAALSY